MEKFSKKRGRPRTIPEEEMILYRELWPDLSTDRSLNNVAHMQTAVRALRANQKKYEYLIGGLVDRKKGKLRRTILTELGRIGDPDEIRDVAAYVCEEEMKTTEAVAVLRFARLYG